MPTNSPSLDDKSRRTPLWIDLFAAQAMLGFVLWPVSGLIGLLPRNPDNSMMAIYTVPAALALALGSGYLLRRGLLAHRALRIVCWYLIAFAAVAVPATMADVVRASGG